MSSSLTSQALPKEMNFEIQPSLWRPESSLRMAEAIEPLWEKIPTGPKPGLDRLGMIKNKRNRKQVFAHEKGVYVVWIVHAHAIGT